MNGIYLSAEELSLLAECSLEAMRLYVLGLRPCMDIKTGTVGRESRVSINGLGTVVGFYPARGSKRKPYLPNHRSIRCQLDELNRVGLTERVSTPEEQKNLMLVVGLSKAKTSENASFCPKDERQMNVTGFDAHKKQQKNLSNHDVKEFSQPAFEDMNASHERHISESQRYKNRDDITARGNFAESAKTSGVARLAQFARLLKTDGWKDSEIQRELEFLKTLVDSGLTPELLQTGCMMARERNATAVSYALKCARTVLLKARQSSAQPQKQNTAAQSSSARVSRLSVGGRAQEKFDPIAFVNRGSSHRNSNHVGVFYGTQQIECVA
ncbi:hypothetical protein [Aquaspirillum soli]